MKRTLKIILKTIVYLLAVIGALTVAFIIFINTSKLYYVSINFNESNLARFEERVDLLRTCGTYSPDSTFVDIEYVKDSIRTKETSSCIRTTKIFRSVITLW